MCQLDCLCEFVAFVVLLQLKHEHPEASKMDVQKLLGERWKQADAATKAK
jgi:hypothetical protein